MATIFGGRACADPVTTRRACEDQGLPTDWWGRANLFRNPLGRGPGRGEILLTKADLDALDLKADHTLRFLDDRTPSAPIDLKRITLLRARCLTPGHRDDPRATYLCELVDRRHFLAQIPTDKAYNVRDADGAGRLVPTLNGDVAWTWAGIVQDLWTALGLGTAPALPFTPDATPENLRYHQVGAWEAVNDVLDRIACAVVLDLTADTFAFVRLGDTAAAGATALTAELAKLDRDGLRLWDAYHQEPDRGRLPEKVRVVFGRRPWPTDGTSPYYAVDVTLAATAGVEPGTVVWLRDDLTALGSGTPSNAAALTTRANERAADWRRKRVGHERRVTFVYRDFRATLKPGETVAGAGLDDRGGVMATELDSGPDGTMERWQPWEPSLGLEAGGGGSGESCADLLTAHQKADCIEVTVEGVEDPITAAWDDAKGGWLLADTVATDDGDAEAVVIEHMGGHLVKLTGDSATPWYLKPTGLCDTAGEAAEFVGRKKPLFLQTDTDVIDECEGDRIRMWVKCAACAITLAICSLPPFDLPKQLCLAIRWNQTLNPHVALAPCAGCSVAIPLVYGTHVGVGAFGSDFTGWFGTAPGGGSCPWNVAGPIKGYATVTPGTTVVSFSVNASPGLGGVPQGLYGCGNVGREVLLDPLLATAAPAAIASSNTGCATSSGQSGFAFQLTARDGASCAGLVAPVVGCASCADGIASEAFGFTLASGTLSKAQLNGAWRLEHVTGCTWVGVKGDCTATLDVAGPTLTLDAPGLPGLVVYTGFTTFRCCLTSAYAGFLVTGSGGSGDAPTISGFVAAADCEG